MPVVWKDFREKSRLSGKYPDAGCPFSPVASSHHGCKNQVLGQFQIWKHLLKSWSCFVESMVSMVPLDHVGCVSWFRILERFSAVARKTGLTADQLRAHGLNSKCPY